MGEDRPGFDAASPFFPSLVWKHNELLRGVAPKVSSYEVQPLFPFARCCQ